MGKSTACDGYFLQLLFTATPIPNIADNASSGPLTNLYLALHTADPGVSGTQATNEVSYTSYARVAVARTAGGWTYSSGTVNPVATISFPACTGGSATATYFSIGSSPNAGQAGVIYYSGSISPTISISNGVTPQLTTASTITES